MNSLLIGCGLISYRPSDGLGNMRLAKAKDLLKTGSSYDFTKPHLKFCLLMRDNYYGWGMRWWVLKTYFLILYIKSKPVQVWPHIFYALSNLNDKAAYTNVHSGNLVNWFHFKLLVATPLLSKLLKSEIEGWSGGKIIEQAKAIGNALDSKVKLSYTPKLISNNLLGINKAVRGYKNSNWYINDNRLMSTSRVTLTHFPFEVNGLNSKRLTTAGHWPVTTLYRGIVTGAEHRLPDNRKVALWTETDWSRVKSTVQKNQIKLVKLAGTQGRDSIKVKKLQLKLAMSLDFRLYAVWKISHNKGSITPGIDGSILHNNRTKFEMVERLRELLISAEKKQYKCKPVKRVMIPKSNGKIRPLVIPTIEDRCLQQLIVLVLEPLIEIHSDVNSYGFRKHRSAKNALGAVIVTLQTGRQYKWVLDAEIKSFFDEISHSWLINNVHLPSSHKYILDKWLKAGALHLTPSGEREYTETLAGTPQGSIISPILANLGAPLWYLSGRLDLTGKISFNGRTQYWQVGKCSKFSLNHPTYLNSEMDRGPQHVGKVRADFQD